MKIKYFIKKLEEGLKEHPISYLTDVDVAQYFSDNEEELKVMLAKVNELLDEEDILQVANQIGEYMSDEYWILIGTALEKKFPKELKELRDLRETLKTYENDDN